MAEVEAMLADPGVEAAVAAVVEVIAGVAVAVKWFTRPEIIDLNIRATRLVQMALLMTTMLVN